MKFGNTDPTQHSNCWSSHRDSHGAVAKLIGAVALSGLVLIHTAGAASLVNPSFEADTFSTFPGYVSGNGPITGWNALGGHGINPGVGFAPFSDNGTIPDGTKVAFMQQDGPMTQTITGLSVGASYEVRYFENARSGGTPYASVTVGGNTVVAAHAVNPVGGTNAYIEVISDPFVATSASMELAFVKSNPLGGDTTLLIDNVSVRTPSTPPSLLAQPSDQVLLLDETAHFSVLVRGSGPLSYQWYFENSPIAGSTSPTL